MLTFEVYELFSGSEREEILQMAMFVSCYYVIYMVSAKYTARCYIQLLYNMILYDVLSVPFMTLDAIHQLRLLKEARRYFLLFIYESIATITFCCILMILIFY